ncbi:hypothetical protein [Luteibaculum oceani]|uniref:DUF4870 domain-containing protein n=1 Tax=Luteibaculum oceani TaxID=1294296 RepID=A0A5C6USA0_9FLAO|nr:hypothetical protein [Luteibaculum oceani]TXC76212.1 hypothetical protein FRX97_10715 [Luteibaculum oceani]
MSKHNDNSAGSALLALFFIFFLIPPFLTAYHLVMVYSLKRYSESIYGWNIGNMIITAVCIILLFVFPDFSANILYMLIFYSGLLGLQIMMLSDLRKLEQEGEWY